MMSRTCNQSASLPPPHKFGLICMAAPFEDMYLQEWLEYNLKIGFTKIVVIQHNWKEEFTQKRMFEDKPVNFINCKTPFDFETSIRKTDRFKIHNVNSFLDGKDDGHFQDYHLVAHFDCDEFLWLDGQTIEQFYESHKDQPAIFVKWRLFGDNGLKSFDGKGNASVLKRFTHCANGQFWNGKTILTDTGIKNGWRWINPHECYLKTSNMKSSDRMFNLSNKNQYLAHFRNKTPEECNVRRSYFNLHNRPDIYYKKFNCNNLYNPALRDFLYDHQIH